MNFVFRLKQFLVILVAFVFLMVSTAQAGKQKNDLPPITDLMQIVKGPENLVSQQERTAAVAEIGQHGNLEAAEALLTLLNTPLEFEALLALSNITDQRAVPLLIPKLSSESLMACESICLILGNIGGDKAVAALLSVAQNGGRKELRQTATHALQPELISNPHGPVIPALLKILKIPVLFQDAEAVLRELKEPSAVPRLYPLLVFESPEARGLGCDIIRFRGDSNSAEPLTALLKKEKDEQVIDKALMALPSVYPPDRLPAVEDLLAGFLQQEKTAPTAVSVIEKYVNSDSPIKPRSIKFLGNSLVPLLKSEDQSLRKSTALVFQKLNYQKASPALIALIKTEKDYHTRHSVICALGGCLQNEEQVRFLIQWGQNHRDDQQAISEAIDGINQPFAVQPLIEELQHPESLFMRDVLSALARLKDPAATQPLLQLLGNKDTRFYCAEEAARMLVWVAGKKELPQMAELLKVERGPGNISLAKSFVALDRLNGFAQFKSLMAAGGKADIDAIRTILSRWRVLPVDEDILIKALVIEDYGCRLMAVNRLALIDSPGVRDALRQIMQNALINRDIRGEAAEALGKYPDITAIQCLLTAYKATLFKKDVDSIDLKQDIEGALRDATGQDFKEPQQWQPWFEAQIKSLSSMNGLIKALDHENDQVGILAARQIRDWPDKDEQRKALVPVLKKLEKNDEYVEISVLAQILGQIGDSSAVSVLLNKLEHQNQLDVVHHIAKALARLKNKQGIACIVNALDEKNQSFLREQPEELCETLAMVTSKPVNYNIDYWKKWWARQ